MPNLIGLVIHDLDKVDEVLHEWLEVGISGLTLLDTSGLSHHVRRAGLRDDLPVFPSVRRMFESTETQNRLLFTIVADDFDLDELIRRTEKVTGSLDSPGTGILFVMPVTRVGGLQPRPAAMD
jgi:nitrogen regulatory protein P-II 1